MAESKTEHDKKAEDYHMYSRIFITAACFLFLGLLLPESIPAAKQPAVLGIIGLFSAASVLFHVAKSRAKQQAEYENQNL
ncbi:YrhC family protein [Salibacterium sp. K-3]